MTVWRALLWAVCFGGYGLAVRATLAADPVVLRRVRQHVRRQRREEPDPPQGVERRPPWRLRVSHMGESLLRRHRLLPVLERQLRLASLDLSAGEYSVIWVGLLLLALALGTMFGLLLGFIAILCALFLPWLYLRWRYRRRLRELSSSLPDFLASLANALRSGFSLLQALDATAKQTPGLLGEETNYLLTETRVGVPVDDALDHLVQRTGSQDVELVASAVQIQRQVGGNLAEVLDRIQATVRDRLRLHGEVRALTAQGRLSGWIVGGLPIFLALALLAMSPSYLAPLVDTGVGHVLIAVGVTLQVLGFIVIRSLVHVEV